MRADLVAEEVAAEPEAANQDRQRVGPEEAQDEYGADEGPHSPC